MFPVLPTGQSIHCWDCNSAYDPRCNDPFDNHSIALVDCNQLSYPHLEVKVATLCRKTMQKGSLSLTLHLNWPAVVSRHVRISSSCSVKPKDRAREPRRMQSIIQHQCVRIDRLFAGWAIFWIIWAHAVGVKGGQKAYFVTV